MKKEDYISIFNILPKKNIDAIMIRLINYLDEVTELDEFIEELFLESDLGTEYLTMGDYFSEREIDDFKEFEFEDDFDLIDDNLELVDEGDETPWYYDFFAYIEIALYLIGKYEYARQGFKHEYTNEFKKLKAMIYDAAGTLGYEIVRDEIGFKVNIRKVNELIVENKEAQEVINLYYGYTTQLSIEKKVELLREMYVKLEKNKPLLHRFYGKDALSVFNRIVNTKDVRHYNGNNFNNKELNTMYDFAFNIGVSCFDILQSLDKEDKE